MNEYNRENINEGVRRKDNEDTMKETSKFRTDFQQNAPHDTATMSAISFTDYKKLKALKEGKYGNVYKCVDNQSKKVFVIKEILTNSNKKKRIISENELCIWKDYHPRIVEYLGFIKDDNGIYIFMEFMEGESIKDSLEVNGALEVASIRRYCHQILEGLHFLHQHNIIYRHMQSSNILRDLHDNVKLKSVFEDDSDNEDDSGLGSLNSPKTSLWKAPESIISRKYSFSSDVWSLGVTVVEMLIGFHPYRDLPTFDALCKIEEEKIIEYKCTLPISKELTSFIEEMLKPNPEDRPTVNLLLKSDFILDEKDEYIRFCKTEIGLDQIDMKEPISEKEWRKYIEKRSGSNILPEHIWEGSYRLLKEISQNNENDKRDFKEIDDIKYFTDFGILCIYARLFEIKTKKWFLFNKEKSIICFRKIISDRFKLLKDNCESSSYLKERYNFMESMVDFLEDILKEYLDNVPEDVHEVSEDIIGIYMINLHIKENYNKKEIFTNMDYKIILRMSKTGKLFNNTKSNIVQIIIKIFKNIHKINILDNIKEVSLSKTQRVAVNCFALALKGSLGGEHSPQKDEILESMLSLLEEISQNIFKNIAATRIAEIILYEICGYQKCFNIETKNTFVEICNRYLSRKNTSEELLVSSSVILCFYAKTFDLPTFFQVAAEKIKEMLERMIQRKLTKHFGFTVEELKEALSEAERKEVFAKVHSPARLLTDCKREHFLRREPLGNRIKYTDEKNKRYYSVIEIFSPNKSLAKKIQNISDLGFHQNLVQYIGTEYDNNMLYIITELMEGGCLKDYLRNYGSLNYILTARCSKQILRGLSFLHEKGIKQKDVNCSNIFMDDLGNMKLDCVSFDQEGDSGFGSSSSSTTMTLSNSEYKKYGFESNTWSFGALVAQMLTGKDSLLNTDLDNALGKNPVPDEFIQFLYEAFATKPESQEEVQKLLLSTFISNVFEDVATDYGGLGPMNIFLGGDKNTCQICKENPRNCFLNCGHVFCFPCCERVEFCFICETCITSRHPWEI